LENGEGIVALNGASAGQPTVRGPVGRFFFDHTISDYPHGRQRAGYLAVAVLASVVLYYAYFVQFGVTPNILASYHMSFNFFIYIDVASNLLGAFASLFASGTDRVGRSNVVIYGLLAVGLLTAVAIPLTSGKWVYLVLICLIGIVEGAILVATPALVRDFSPQLGRASAMGFWTIGPVAGSLITSIVALHTLNHFGATHWKSQFVIAGGSALVVFLISLFALKDLSPRIRDQLMVSARDQALVEARARGLTDHQLLEAAERPWQQIFKPSRCSSCSITPPPACSPSITR
jgi:MFS family permease